jgi:hypothetical protein
VARYDGEKAAVGRSLDPRPNLRQALVLAEAAEVSQSSFGVLEGEPTAYEYSLAQERGRRGGAMPIEAALEETLVGLDELDEVAKTSGDEIEAYVNTPDGDPKFSLPVGKDVTLGPAELRKARQVKSTANPYNGIGIGKPLAIVIKSIYLGNYPDAVPHVPYLDRGDVLVTSAHKAFETFEAAPRAVHLLQANAKRGASLQAKATEQGRSSSTTRRRSPS